MKTSIVLPSHARPRKLAACLTGLAPQVDRETEVLVGLDGPNTESVDAAHNAWATADGPPGSLIVEELPRAGANECRNRMIDRSTGELLILLNDDVVPRPGFLEAHRAAHRRQRSITIGYSPYAPVENPTLLDAIVAETDLVFPWRAMLQRAELHGPEADHGFRCAVTLNFSIRMDNLRAVNGFTDSAGLYGHDDLEFAHRACTQLGLPVLFEPAAVADHDHRHTALDLLRREALLGASAWHYAQANPAFGRELVGHDLSDPERLAYYARYTATETRDARRSALAFMQTAELPAAGDPTILQALSQQHLVARRWLWRSGLLAQAGGCFDADAILAQLELETARAAA